MGAILLAAVVGGIAFGGIAFMITKWWNSGNRKAIDYLNQILEKLDKLVNLHFII